MKTIDNIWIIGDVHGCYYTLMQLVNKLPKDAKLIFVGDLCDKGNFSKEVFEFVINNNHTCIYGNHEELFSKHIKDVIYNNIHKKWSNNSTYGGMKTVDNYKYDTSLLDKHLNWIETLPKYIQIDNYFITHGFGLPYYQRKDRKKLQKSLYTNRIDDDKFKNRWEDYQDYDVINIFGHCKFDEVLIGKNYYGIDTSCVYKNKLTALNLSSKQIIQQDLIVKDIKNNNDYLQMDLNIEVRTIIKIDINSLDKNFVQKKLEIYKLYDADVYKSNIASRVCQNDKLNKLLLIQITQNKYQKRISNLLTIDNTKYEYWVDRFKLYFKDTQDDDIKILLDTYTKGVLKLKNDFEKIDDYLDVTPIEYQNYLKRLNALSDMCNNLYSIYKVYKED